MVSLELSSEGNDRSGQLTDGRQPAVRFSAGVCSERPQQSVASAGLAGTCRVDKIGACDWRNARAANGEPEAETANQAENEAGGIFGFRNRNFK